jgi:hypothetical protein
MHALSPPIAGLLADAILLTHAGVVVFVVAGLPVILIGGWRDWRWVRGRAFRFTHLALIAFIVVQTWLGQLCPLTVWENQLRQIAGHNGYTDSFIEHWLSRLLFFDAPWWVFVVAYSVFGLLVALAWWWVPPRSKP